MTDTNRALFVVSAGRCGTQWLAGALAQILGDAAVVTHEPLDNDYAPRQMLGAGDPSSSLLAHVGWIEEVLRSKHYVECGHPSWSSMPYLMRRFQGRVNVVHLLRHPVPNAFSWLTQAAYCPPAAPHLREKTLLSPFDAGVRFPAYRDRWDHLTPYEKTLYYWLEVNALASELPGALRVHYEVLFDPDSLDRILALAGLQVGGKSTFHVDRVDRFHYASPVWFDPRLIERHPEVMRLSVRLGYDPLGFDEAELRRRYRWQSQ